ncbi:MAG TPA: hypothetical protein VK453_20385 [Micromonosporaceae bacterium]|nr:hypothetical protein [Micromonosporaceae bacterium]
MISCIVMALAYDDLAGSAALPGAHDELRCEKSQQRNTAKEKAVTTLDLLDPRQVDPVSADVVTLVGTTGM